MRVLLDTATFLWIATDDDRLSATARQIFQDPNSEVYLSAASVWEIALKYRIGRLVLPQTPGRLIPDLRTQHGIEPLSMTEEAALQEAKLPGHHRDPFDRMLVCQAVVHGLVVLTPDSEIAQYPIRVAW